MDKIQEFLQSAGNKVSALSIPHFHVPEGVWILAAAVVLGAVAWAAIHHRLRTRFVGTHLRRLLKSGAVKAIHWDGDTKTLFVVDSSGETVIPKKPYKGDAVPAKHFEGITPREVFSGALMLKRLAYVVFSSWPTKDDGPEHWRIEPQPTSTVMLDTPQRPRKEREDRSRAVTAAASSGSNRDHRPERDKRPEQESAPATLQ